MRSDVRQRPPAPGKAPAVPIRRTPGVGEAAPDVSAAPRVGLRDAGAHGQAHAPERTRQARRLLGRRWLRWALGALGVLALCPRALAQGQRVPDGVVAEVRIEGNVSIASDRIRPKLLTRVGKPFKLETATEDTKTLWNTKWFSDVQLFCEEKSPKSGKLIVTFQVVEKSLLTKVEFIGRKGVRLKEIEDTTDLKVGRRADPTHARLAVGQILRLYQEKGYDFAEVKLIKGGKPGDTEIVIQIFEGPKVHLSSINFIGSQFAAPSTLKTHITSRVPILGLFGRYHRDMLDEDKQKLVDYYQSQGFFLAKVTPVTRPGPGPGDLDLTFVIHEGPRFSVRNVILEGNSQLKTAALMDDLELRSGKPFLRSMRDADKRRMLIKYGEIGCIDAEIQDEPKFTNELGVVDLVYKVEEGNPYLMAELQVNGNATTRDKVIRREAVQAGLLPGEVLDKNRIEIFRKRLESLGYFTPQQQGPGAGKTKPIEIKIANRRPKDKPYGEIMPALISEATQARMQDAGPGTDPPAPPLTVPTVQPLPLPEGEGGGATVAPPPAGEGGGLFNRDNPFDPPPDVMPPIEVPTPPPAAPGPAAPGMGGGARPVPGLGEGMPPGQPPIGAGEPPGTWPSIPGMGMTNVGPDRGDAFPNRAFADIITSVEESPTGRLMFSVGANSFQGLIGSVSIWEKNFDLFRPPLSWDELFSGRAFRGGGQELRINAQAGTLINMMMFSLREPYLFDLPIGAGVSGYLFSRFYPYLWDERRGGGRINIGRQLGTSTYFDVSAWAEQVDFFGYQTPAPAQYLAASGYTQLYAIQPSIRFDNRNNPFMPTKGQYANFSVEQGFGTFIFTKFNAEGRLYLPTYSRPDGTGKQFFTLRGHFGIATQSTPVYERLFAGNFASLRGFYYRTVSPHVFGVPIGGVMMGLGSVEYQFPWNAKDTINQILFVDFGTVTSGYEFNNMRVSVGAGLKVNIPMFGPLPLEFDLAFPVLHSFGDRIQYFNFSVGANY